MVEARFVSLGVGHRVVAHHHARRLGQPGLDGVVQPEVAHHPVEQRRLDTPLSRRREGRRRKVVTGEDAARPGDPVQAADPFRGFLNRVLGNAPDRGAGRHAPRVMRFVVDDQDAAGARQVSQHGADVGFVAHGPALIDAPLPGELLVRLPVQRVPVADGDPALAQLVEQGPRHHVERFVVVLRVRGLEHRQPASDRQPGGDDLHVFGEPGVVRRRGLVEHLPRQQHSHDDGLARAGRHLGARPWERPAAGRNLQTGPVGRGRFRKPDQRFHGLDLTEEEAPVVERFRVRPILQQPLGDARDARPAGLAPRPHARPNPVDQRNLDEHARVVERPGVIRGHDVAGRPSARSNRRVVRS